MFRLWEGRFEPLLRRAAPDFGEFVSLEAVPPTENVPRPSVAKGLRNRLTGTAIRRDRVPQWLKPSVWPFYLIIVVAVG